MKTVLKDLQNFDTGEVEDTRHLIPRRVRRYWCDIAVGTELFEEEADVFSMHVRTSAPPAFVSRTTRFWIDEPIPQCPLP